jgi:hypothetical protein
MGGTSTRSFDFTSYAATASTYKAASTATAAFKARALDPYLDPSKFTVRESRNSPGNPKSTPVIIGFDVTGSMGHIPHKMVSEGLGKLMQAIIDRNPVSDPHLMFMAIGDCWCDRSPLQVSQFETDMKIVDQLDKIHVEQGGGGNFFESYNLPWHFANFHTSADCFEKDGRKGFLFTMGDELPPADLTDANLLQVYGRQQEPAATNKQLLEALSSKYHVFHLMIEEGSGMRFDSARTVAAWKELMGQRAIPVSDYTKLPEIIISIIQSVNGVNKDAVAKSWSGDTSLAVTKALSGIDGALTVTGSTGGGLVRL